MKDDSSTSSLSRIRREALLTQAYIDAHPPLIPQALLERELFRSEVEISILERLQKLMQEAIAEKQGVIAELEGKLRAQAPIIDDPTETNL